jgi:predicted acylesterase/phospholipase RssA
VSGAPSAERATSASVAQGAAEGKGKLGLLLPGGAVKGAYQAGAIAALAEAGLEFDVVVGTSVGAVNGVAFLLDYGPRLMTMWSEHLRDLCWFDRGRILKGRSPFMISESMRALVERYGDVSRLTAHPTEMVFSVTDWETRENVLFSSHDGVDWSDAERVDQFLASLTIPLVCSDKIVLRGRRYCDGGLSNNYPLEALLERGCRRIVVIDPSPSAGETGGSSWLDRIISTLEWAPVRSLSLFAGLCRAQERRLDGLPEGVRLWLLDAPADGEVNALDFKDLETVERLLALGLEEGRRFAAELKTTLCEGEP